PPYRTGYRNGALMSTVAYIGPLRHWRAALRAIGVPGSGGSRIATEHPHGRAKLLQFGQRAGHGFVLAMSLQVGQKHVLPTSPRCRPRLDATQIQAGAIEDLERFSQRAAAVRSRKYQARFVVTRPRGVTLANHHEARRVLGIVLDPGDQHAQAIELSGEWARDRCQSGVARGFLRCGRGRQRRDLERVRQVFGEPASTLRESLWMRSHALNAAEIIGQAE